MRKIISILFCLVIFTSFHSFGQKLVEDEVDEFTGNTVKRTSWECINMNFTFTTYFRISKINENLYFDFKMMLASGKVFAIDKDQELMFKLDNDSIVGIQNSDYAVTCTGCGATSISGSRAQGLRTVYIMNAEQSEQLINNTIVKFRVYLIDGYVENKMKLKNYKKIQKALSLVN